MRIKLNRIAGSLLAFGCVLMFVSIRAKGADPVDSSASTAGTAQKEPAPLALPAGTAPAKEAAEAPKLSGSLETATEDALKKDVGMSGILTCFVEQDRSRLKDIADGDKIDPAK